MGFSSKHQIIFILMFISAYRDQTIIAQAQESTPYYLAWKFCFGTNYTANSTYRTNLNLFFSSLSTTFTNNNVPLHGYSNFTIGESPNVVYGSLHCREDMTQAICSKCVQIATERVIMQDSGCPNRKTTILFYNGCILRYSDENYFSVLRQQPSIDLTYTDNSVADQVQYIDIITGLLDDLVIEAVTNTSISPSLYATRSANYTRSDQVYAMVQCTPDLTPSVCYKCLRSALGRLSRCCSGAQGARVLFPSCTFRFEKAPFFGNYMYNTIRASPPPLQASPPTFQSPSNSTNPNGNGKVSSKLVISIVIPLVIAVLLFSIVVWWFCFLKRKKKAANIDPDIQSAESLLFNFSTISAATNNFSADNKLGEGGFGPVYKGTLSDGQEIAVKRLSKNSSQGDQEFKNEVLLLAKLQHRNLVKLLGFCLHGEEKLLVYELMNSSLDHFIFDTLKRTSVDWERRYKIIGGIARGLLYLHEDSRLTIIHRDLKASNILIAADMTPKISDFGMARLFEANQTQANTMRIAGTCGYMAPEYALHGRFSVKSDVFSFGVLLLEILSGKKNTSFHESITGCARDLLTHAWRLWQQDGSVMELLDSSLKENCSRSECMRCVHIALLCVQDSIADRPTMASVIHMLNSNSMALPLPTRPAYFISDEAIEEVWSANEVSVTELDPR